MKQDYYELLNSAKNATSDELKKAYRKQAMKFHPDRNPGNKEAEDQFKLAAEAYGVLSDPQKRQVYDAYGHSGLDNRGFHGFSGASNEDIFSSFSDIFSDFFGFGGDVFGSSRGSTRPRRGSDLRYDLKVSFMEAIKGAEKKIEIPKTLKCQTCDGSGAKPGTKPHACTTCRGSGTIQISQGFFSIRQTCNHCNGSGEFIDKKCPTCRGNGTEEKMRQLKIAVPAGIDNGTRMRLSGEGEFGTNNGPPGDLYLFIHVDEDDYFIRDGADIHCEHNIDFVEATLGCDITVKTLDGEKTIQIPAGIQYGEEIILKGLGAKKLRGFRNGNQIVKIFVNTPTKISKKQEALLKEYLKLKK